MRYEGKTEILFQELINSIAVQLQHENAYLELELMSFIRVRILNKCCNIITVEKIMNLLVIHRSLELLTIVDYLEKKQLNDSAFLLKPVTCLLFNIFKDTNQ